MIQHSKKKQTSDFKPNANANAIIHRNPPTPPMRCFDDTFVSMFEIALSLEVQNAFKQSDISTPLHIISFTPPQAILATTMSLLLSRSLRSQQQIPHRPCRQPQSLLPARHAHAGRFDGGSAGGSEADEHRHRSQGILRPRRRHPHSIPSREHGHACSADGPLARRRRGALRLSHHEGDLPAVAGRLRDVRRALRGERGNHAERGGAAGDRELHRRGRLHSVDNDREIHE